MKNAISLNMVVAYSILVVCAIIIMAIPIQIAEAEEEQTGLYLVDDDSQHYYDINNCSNEKGSSGGSLSECEDAAKEIHQEEEF